MTRLYCHHLDVPGCTRCTVVTATSAEIAAIVSQPTTTHRRRTTMTAARVMAVGS